MSFVDEAAAVGLRVLHDDRGLTHTSDPRYLREDEADCAARGTMSPGPATPLRVCVSCREQPGRRRHELKIDPPPPRNLPPFKASAPGWWVVALDDEGSPVMSAGPGFLQEPHEDDERALQRALFWFQAEVEEAKMAPPEWAAARISEVHLIWKKP